MEEAGQLGTEQQHKQPDFETKILELASAAAEARAIVEAANERFVRANFLLTKAINEAVMQDPSTYDKWFQSLPREQIEAIRDGSEDPFTYVQVE